MNRDPSMDQRALPLALGPRHYRPEAREEECFDSRSSVSSSSYGDDDDDDRITWGDNKSGSSDCVSEGHADEDEEEDY